MTRVYVGHLSYRVRERDLERFFRGFGKIREVLLKNGFGFVVSTVLMHSLQLRGTIEGNLSPAALMRAVSIIICFLNVFRSSTITEMPTMLCTSSTAENWMANGASIQLGYLGGLLRTGLTWLWVWP